MFRILISLECIVSGISHCLNQTSSSKLNSPALGKKNTAWQQENKSASDGAKVF